MKAFHLISIIIFCSLVTLACKEEENLMIEDSEYLIFGHFYGECIGPNCVETYKLANGRLFEDELDDYNHERFSFIALDDAQYQLAKNLRSNFPEELIEIQEDRLGCPDCADQGGIYLEVLINNEKRYWLIDQSDEFTPDFLNDYKKQINATISALEDNDL